MIHVSETNLLTYINWICDNASRTCVERGGGGRRGREEEKRGEGFFFSKKKKKKRVGREAGRGGKWEAIKCG